MRMDDRRQYRELRACPQETLLGNQRDGAESGLVRGMIWLDEVPCSELTLVLT